MQEVRGSYPVWGNSESVWPRSEENLHTKYYVSENRKNSKAMVWMPIWGCPSDFPCLSWYRA